MRRIVLLVAAALAVSACTIGATPVVPDELLASTSTTADSTTTGTAASTTATEAGLVTTTCPTDDVDFRPLCETVTLIHDHYVDDIDDSELAQAAAAAIDALGSTSGGEAATACVLPSDAFLVVCQSLDDAGTDAGTAVEAAIEGMIRSTLDSNSAYLDPEALAVAQDEQSGQVEGIGALVTTEDLTSADPDSTPCEILSETCRLVIVSVLDGSPAESAGLRSGDEMVSVDGKDLDGMAFDVVTARVRGPAGTEVELGIARNGIEIQVRITRAAIDIPVTQSQMVGTTGYLRLNLFTEIADETVGDELSTLLASGATRIVFDLRDNPGGTLNAAVGVASQFLADGLVLLTESPDHDTPYPVIEGGVAADRSVDVIVLVNRGSASASEVVAGVLQESGRAILVGETTFGKNTVQQRFSLSNGGAVKLTIARWVTPAGADFDSGIAPDVELQLGDDLAPEELVAAALSAVGA